MNVIQAFPAKFDLHLQIERGADATEFCYPGAVEGGWVEGISLEVIPNNRPRWFASFARGQLSPNAASGVVTLPDPSKFLVISCGEGYVIDSHDPKTWEHLKLLPVMGFAVAKRDELVLVWDFSHVIALGKDGVAWRTPAISWDGVSSVEIEDGYADVTVWNAPKNTNQIARIDLRSGSVDGGTSPELAGAAPGSR